MMTLVLCFFWSLNQMSIDPVGVYHCSSGNYTVIICKNRQAWQTTWADSDGRVKFTGVLQRGKTHNSFVEFWRNPIYNRERVGGITDWRVITDPSAHSLLLQSVSRLKLQAQ